MKNDTTIERKSERELVVTRTFNGPARIVFEAWTQPELFKRWWVPKSIGLTLLSCEMDVRVGGGYRLVFAGNPEPMAFFGKYLEVTPHSRLSWSNDESPDGAITTVTFEESGGKTRVVVHDLYPSKEALDAAIASESTGGFTEQFEQLDELLPTIAPIISHSHRRSARIRRRPCACRRKGIFSLYGFHARIVAHLLVRGIPHLLRGYSIHESTTVSSPSAFTARLESVVYPSCTSSSPALDLTSRSELLEQCPSLLGHLPIRVALACRVRGQDIRRRISWQPPVFVPDHRNEWMRGEVPSYRIADVFACCDRAISDERGLDVERAR